MTTLGNLPIKTRVPLKAWAVAGLMTVFSIVSSLMHVAPTQARSLSASTVGELTISARDALHASLNW